VPIVFPAPAGGGTAHVDGSQVPYGIHDIGADTGWVSVGCDVGETSTLAVVRTTWLGQVTQTDGGTS